MNRIDAAAKDQVLGITPDSYYKALDNFKEISLAQKIMALFLTFLASVTTLCIATVFVFRAVVWRYYKQLHPLPPVIDPSKILPPEPLNAANCHQVALRTMSVESMLRALQKGHQGVHSCEYFKADGELMVHGEEIHVMGSYAKATVEMENGPPRFVYVMDALIQDRGHVFPIKGVFFSPDNICNLFAIGQLCFEQALQNLYPPLKPFGNAIALPESFTNLFPIDAPAFESQGNIGKLVEDRVVDEELEKRRLVEEAIQNQTAAFERSNLGRSRKYDPQASAAEHARGRADLGLDESACNLVPYILQFFQDLKSSEMTEAQRIENKDYLVFAHGKISKTEDEIEAKQFYKVFSHILKETFGINLADGIFGRYLLDRKEVITLLDLKKAMVGIALNVREFDLENLFGHIKSDEPEKLLSYKVGNLLPKFNRVLYDQIRQVNDFDNLNPAQVNFLHAAFKIVPLSASVTLSEVLNQLQPGSDKIEYLYWHDLAGLEEMEYWKDLCVNVSLELSLGEFVGKGLGYVEMLKGMIIPIPEIISKPEINYNRPNPYNVYSIDPDKPPHFYKVHSSLSHKNDAVIAHLLCPFNSQQTPIIKEAGVDHCFLIFRGTNIDEGALDSNESLLRDADANGIGATSYDAREDEILSMVEKFLIGAKDKVVMQLAGHSLGGCDTQRALLSITEKIASEPSHSPWRKLKEVILTTFNAPKPNFSVNGRFKLAIKKIHNDGSINMKIDLLHVRFFDAKNEDVLQFQGDILLGVDHDGTEGTPLKDAPFLKRELFMVTATNRDDGRIGGFLKRHQYRPFTLNHRSTKQVEFEMRIISPQSEIAKGIVSPDSERFRIEMEKHMAWNFFWEPGLIPTIKWVLGDGIKRFGTLLQTQANNWHASYLENQRKKNAEREEIMAKRRLALAFPPDS